MSKQELLDQINDAASRIEGTNNFDSVDNQRKARMIQRIKQNNDQPLKKGDLMNNKKLTSQMLNELPDKNNLNLNSIASNRNLHLSPS